MQEWEQIQALMRKQGKEGLLRRVRLFDTVDVTENMVNSAAQLLRDYDEERVRASSAGLATFYKWATNVIDEVMNASDESPTESKTSEPAPKKKK